MSNYRLLSFPKKAQKRKNAEVKEFIKRWIFVKP